MAKKFNNFYRILESDDLCKQQIDEAMDFMKRDKQGIGEKLKKLWPKQYVKKHGISTHFDIVYLLCSVIFWMKKGKVQHLFVNI
jgi:hypothetical protein